MSPRATQRATGSMSWTRWRASCATRTARPKSWRSPASRPSCTARRRSPSFPPRRFRRSAAKWKRRFPMSDRPHKDPVYLPAAPGWWLHPYGGTGIAVDSPIVAWRIDGYKAFPVIPDDAELAVGGLEVVFKDPQSRPRSRSIADDPPEYGLGGKNY